MTVISNFIACSNRIVFDFDFFALICSKKRTPLYLMIEVLPEILRRKMLNSNTVLSLLNSLYVACL